MWFNKACKRLTGNRKSWAGNHSGLNSLSWRAVTGEENVAISLSMCLPFALPAPFALPFAPPSSCPSLRSCSQNLYNHIHCLQIPNKLNTYRRLKRSRQSLRPAPHKARPTKAWFYLEFLNSTTGSHSSSDSAPSRPLLLQFVYRSAVLPYPRYLRTLSTHSLLSGLRPQALRANLGSSKYLSAGRPSQIIGYQHREQSYVAAI